MSRSVASIDSPNRTRQNGFTLIELMIVMVIIGVLAAIALPGYQQYVIKSNRRAAQAFMMDVASREKQYFLDVRSYVAAADNAALAADTGLKLNVPTDVGKRYTISVTLDAGPPLGFTVTAVPLAGTGQAGDGTLTLTSAGVKGTDATKW